MADIEEQVIALKRADADATPEVEVIREYTDSERGIITRSLRARLAGEEAGFIFHPYLSVPEQQSAAGAYKRYINGEINLSTLNRVRTKLVPYAVASTVIMAAADKDVNIRDTEKIAAFADEIPEVWQTWFRYAQLKIDSNHESLSDFDPTTDITANESKFFPDPIYTLNYFKWVTPRESVERVALANQRITAMEKLVDEGRFLYSREQGFYYYTPGNRAVEADDVNRGRNFKIHIMPQIENVPAAPKVLAEYMRSDKDFNNSIKTFKVLERPTPDAEIGDHPTPEIVIYPQPTEQAIISALSKVRALFAGQAGRGCVPRFNIPVEGNIVFLAEGHGHEKLALKRAGELGGAYDEDTNHAFKPEDEALARWLIEASKS